MDSTRVKVNLGVTCNIGNFQNIRIDIGVDDFRREDETAKQAVDRVYKFVERELEERIEATQQDVKRNIDG